MGRTGLAQDVHSNVGYTARFVPSYLRIIAFAQLPCEKKIEDKNQSQTTYSLTSVDGADARMQLEQEVHGKLLSTNLDTPIGAMMVVVDDESVRLLEFVERRALPGEITRLGSSHQTDGGDPHAAPCRP